MAAQISDRYLFEGKTYEFIHSDRDIEFQPERYGIEAKMMSPNCWRGFISTYEITDRLKMEGLEIWSHKNQFPDLYRVAPARESVGTPLKPFYRASYKNLKHLIRYSGKLILGFGMIERYQSHSSFRNQNVWAFEEVKEFVFKAGKVVDMKDHSHYASGIRDKLNDNPNFWKDADWDVYAYFNAGGKNQLFQLEGL